MKKSLRKIGIGSTLSIGLLSGCVDNSVLEGKIVKESFYPSGGFGSIDRHTALVEIGGDTLTTNNYRREAREIDLKYDVGDSVKVKMDSNGYKIIH